MWPDIAAWFQSPGGARVLQTAIVPALAILVAGVLAALIARAALRAALRRADREQAATAVAGLVDAARAAAESEGGRDRRRAARLRTEADVRVRLLPLPGAARAADWAAAATEALADGRPTADLAAVRDPLVEWVKRPRRARRLFARPAQVGSAPVPAPPVTTPEPPEPEEQGASAPAPEVESSARPDRTFFEPARVPAAAAAAAADDADGAEVPAWRRTRSAERLQQAHESRTDPEAAPEGTAPVTVAHAHRATGEPDRTPKESEEPHQPARRSTAVAVEDEAEAAPPARRAPEWLDTYDDEADVTQNLDLRTPPPVAASAVRDRAPSTDIVPRP